MGSVTYNNVPLNLNQNDKFSLLFYGIFSRSQTRLSGDPTNKENIASLKIPFMFTLEEIYDSAGLFNNRVGAGGPLYSGLLVFSLSFLLAISFKTTSQKERYTIYSAFTVVGLILFLSLLAPTPNLFRYVSQLQLLPFAIMIPLYAVFKRNYVKISAYVLLILITVNVTLFSIAVFHNNLSESKKINAQFNGMRNSGKTNYVKAQHFYSNYVLLYEHHVPFYIVNALNCGERAKDLVSSSNTTHFCLY